MPRSRKINLGNVQASLDTPCPKCGFATPPNLIKRVDFERVECPKCGERFQPATSSRKNQLNVPLSREYKSAPESPSDSEALIRASPLLRSLRERLASYIAHVNSLFV
jgi:predicted RNA-binding Zn-ribbon protein involved in translation (DUF1610 family)